MLGEICYCTLTELLLQAELNLCICSELFQSKGDHWNSLSYVWLLKVMKFNSILENPQATNHCALGMEQEMSGHITLWHK